MPNPALLPACAILAGVACGVLFPEHAQGAIAVGLVLSWAAGVCGFAQQRRAVFVVCAVLGFGGAAYVLGASATRRALNPPLRAFFEQIAYISQTPEPDAPFSVEGVLTSDAAASASGASFRLNAARVRYGNREAELSGAINVAVGGSLGSERLVEWRAGRSIRAAMLLRLPTRYFNFGLEAREKWQLLRGAALLGYVKSAPLVEMVAIGPWYAEWASAARAYVRRALEATVSVWSPQSAGIVTAIVIGDRVGLSTDTERRLQEAGTYHVIAISGGNIAIFVTIVLGLARVARVGSRPAVIGTMTVVLAYAYIAGGGASVSRAALMAVVCLGAQAIDQRSSTLNGIALTAAVMLCVAPLTIVDAGFVLTFGATIGIVVLAPHVCTWLPPSGGRGAWIRRPAAMLFAASLAAEVALFPVGAWLFGRVTFAGLALNFLAIPLMAVAQAAGMAAIALYALPVPLAAVATACGYVAHLGAGGLVWSTSLLDAAPWLAMRVLPPPWWLIVGYYVSGAVWLWTNAEHHDVVMIERLRVLRRSSAGAVGGIALFIVASPQSALGSGIAVQATFVDVGQGDSALLRFGGQNVLIDTGGLLTRGDYDFGERVLTPALWGVGVTRVEHLALTHGDPDHIGGAPAVLRSFDVHQIWEGVPVPRHLPMEALAADAATRGITWRSHRAGDALRIGGARLLLWHPPPPDWERQRVRNDDSLVIEVKAGDISILMTGDIGRDVERDLASRIPRAPLRILKVPHHGSLTSSSFEFLSAVHPDVAIISCGRGNRYGHPAPDVVDRYRRLGALVLRTDLDGAIQLETDGYTAVIRTYMGRRFTLRAHR